MLLKKKEGANLSNNLWMFSCIFLILTPSYCGCFMYIILTHDFVCFSNVISSHCFIVNNHHQPDPQGEQSLLH